jgi:hypothetical protein
MGTKMCTACNEIQSVDDLDRLRSAVEYMRSFV